jgi:hypothetical protein
MRSVAPPHSDRMGVSAIVSCSLVMFIDDSDAAVKLGGLDFVRSRHGDDGRNVWRWYSRRDVATMPPIEWPMMMMDVPLGYRESM